MGRLIYSAIASLDGYIEDADGEFRWAAPDAEVHAFINDLERPIGTYLYGRRLYEVMSVWETMEDDHPQMRDYAEVWRAAEKVVYSTTLTEAPTPRTRVEREFDPSAVARLKEAAGHDLAVGGPALAAEAIRAGLVDEYHLFAAPVVVGGGKRWLPESVRVDLELLEERRFASGFVYLRYAALASGTRGAA